MQDPILGRDFFNIINLILKENKNIEQWSEIESDDLFQEGSYAGGFDATEKEFTFSYFTETGGEFWFQIPLNKIEEISKSKEYIVKIYTAQY